MNHLSKKEVDLLRQNARSMVRELGLLNDAYFEIGVTLAERHLLIELSTSASPTMGEIAERLLLDKSTASRLISKAMKKGYIKCTSDEKDKRKRFLHLSELGKKTLNAFEPIAFNQTKEALATLSTEEMELVHQGVALYAKGLRTSRLQNKPKMTPKQPTEPPAIHVGEYTLKPYSQEDENDLYEIFREVVEAGNQFPYDCNSPQEFYRQFLDPNAHVYVCHSANQEIVGGYFIKQNYSGRSNHIANAAYMVKKNFRGRGIGTLLLQTSLQMAKQLGFHAMQFNMVLSQNTGAIKLYKKLGFQIIGTIPSAIRNPDGSFQDGYTMYRRTDDL